MEQLDEIEVALVLAEVLFEQDVDAALEHESVVDGNHANLGHEVPAGRATARLGRVHDVVRNKEEGLQQLNHPAKGGRAEVLLFAQRAVEQQRRRVDDRHAAVALAADSVVVERFLEPFERLFGELVLLAVVAEVLHELREDRLELFERCRHGGGRAEAQGV